MKKFNISALEASSTTPFNSAPSWDIRNTHTLTSNDPSYGTTSLSSNTPSGFLQQGELSFSTGLNIKSVPSSSPTSRPSDSDAVRSMSDSQIPSRAWVQEVLEDGLRDLIQIVDHSGKILYASSSCKILVGYSREELMGHSVFEFIAPNDSSTFIRELNGSITTGMPAQFFYRLKKRDGSYLMLEAYGRVHSMTSRITADSSTAPELHTVFTIIARPYLTSSSRFFDSLLEHKMENEQLTRQIAELRQEEEEHETFQTGSQRHYGPDPSQFLFYDTQLLDGSVIGSGVMVSSATPGLSSTCPTSQRQGEPSSALFHQNAKAARFGDSSYIDDIEIMTGLHYRAGERSHGISTGDSHATLIHSAVPISLPTDKQDRVGGSNDKKRRTKAEEYVCMDCGTLSSPEWRKGPNGKKTLCNACGCE